MNINDIEIIIKYKDKQKGTIETTYNMESFVDMFIKDIPKIKFNLRNYDKLFHTEKYLMYLIYNSLKRYNKDIKGDLVMGIYYSVITHLQGINTKRGKK